MSVNSFVPYPNMEEHYLQKVDYALSLLNDPSWELEKEDKDIVFYRRYAPNDSFAMIKSIVTIPDCSIDDIIEQLSVIEPIDSSTPSNKKHGIAERRVLHDQGKEGFCVFYIAMEPPGMMISGRDFVLIRKMLQKDGKLLFINVSSEDDSVLPPNRTYVRGQMDFQGFIAEPDPANPKNIKLVFMAHANPKGSIPSMIYNSVVMNQGYAAKGVRSKILGKKSH